VHIVGYILSISIWDAKAFGVLLGSKEHIEQTFNCGVALAGDIKQIIQIVFLRFDFVHLLFVKCSQNL